MALLAWQRGAPLDLPADEAAFDLVTGDLSFISLTTVLPKLVALTRPGGQLVLLVKPQFEVGRGAVGKGGIVRDAATRARALARVAEAAVALGLELAGDAPSALAGAKGNREHFLRLRRPA